MNEKINKLAKQHEVIGVKTDCPYFSTIGRLCSRVENGMMRCDEYLECEFKYIDVLKEENERLKEELASFMNGDYCAEGCKKMNNAFRDAHKGILEENEKLKEYIKDLQVRKDRYYLQVLEYEKQISGWISFYIKVRDIVSGNYEILESQGLQELRRIISEVTND